jgi:hypothetical protein
MIMISLIQLHDNSRAAELDPETGHVLYISRTRKEPDDGQPPYWLPEVGDNGWYQILADLFVAVYRDPSAPSALWLQLGDRRLEIGEGTRAEFEPEIENGEPRLENADVERAFRLFQDGHPVAEHAYRLDDREKRLYYGMDPFPAWPDEEENYDLLFLVHQILIGERWKGVLRRGY